MNPSATAAATRAPVIPLRSELNMAEIHQAHVVHTVNIGTAANLAREKCKMEVPMADKLNIKLILRTVEELNDVASTGRLNLTNGPLRFAKFRECLGGPIRDQWDVVKALQETETLDTFNAAIADFISKFLRDADLMKQKLYMDTMPKPFGLSCLQRMGTWKDNFAEQKEIENRIRNANDARGGRGRGRYQGNQGRGVQGRGYYQGNSQGCGGYYGQQGRGYIGGCGYYNQGQVNANTAAMPVAQYRRLNMTPSRVSTGSQGSNQSPGRFGGYPGRFGGRGRYQPQVAVQQGTHYVDDSAAYYVEPGPGEVAQADLSGGDSYLASTHDDDPHQEDYQENVQDHETYFADGYDEYDESYDNGQW